MVDCGACGRPVDIGFAFCPHCANPMSPPSSQGTVERKVVSVLFCDLVGSTAAAEGADPEDVRARLAGLHRMLARILEGHGGTVEKFAGDAVLAVFGAPVAHEDDTERAIRAGLAILDEAARINARDASAGLHLRVGVNTGETVVDHSADPARGVAFVFGDVVNTAARIQASADVDGIAVGESAFHATERVFDFEAREPFMAKGKRELIPTWRVLRARSRLGVDIIRDLSTPLIGRDDDVRLLRGAFEKSVRDRVAQLITVVGEPGVGKSRLVAELLAHVEERPDLVAWRQGRCLPYGEGITYWALGEIVKAHAGIDESDDAEVAAAKLRDTVRAVGDADAVIDRLLPLIGIDSGVAAAREESFRAWLTYIESFASTGPLVLVFEDVHWADDSLLAFIEHLAEWVQDVPVLIVCTARPELLAEHPSWGAGSVSGTTLRLSRLSQEQTAELVAALLDGIELPHVTRLAILERAGGNPLYAEEFVRMLRDRGLLVEGAILGEGSDVPLPQGVHALIAARLDVTTPLQKELLLAASVVGKVFSPEAIAGLLARSVGDLEADLHALTRKEFIRPQRRTIGEGGFDYSFWHVLIRDVAYASLPRAHRASLHAALVGWTERTASDRLEDAAEILAYHAEEARQLAVALGDADLASEMSESARRWHLLAGERAFGLDTQAAVRHLAAAWELTPEGHPDRLPTRARYGSALFDARRMEEAVEVLAPVFEAVDANLELADDQRVAESVMDLYNASMLLGRFASMEGLEPFLERAYAFLPEGKSRSFVAGARSSGFLLAGPEADVRRAIVEADAAWDVARRRGWPARFADVTATIGRALLGDHEAYARLEATAERARRLERPTFVAFSYGWQALADRHWSGPGAAIQRLDDGLRYADERGLNAFIALGAGRLIEHLTSGSIAKAQEDAATLSSLGFAAAATASERLWLALEMGEASPEAESALRTLADDPDTPRIWLTSSLILLARTALTCGDADQARLLLEQVDIEALLGDRWSPESVPVLGRALLAVADADRLRTAREHARRFTPLDALIRGTLEAQVHEVEHRFGEAAEAYDVMAGQWADFGYHLEAAYAMLGCGRCLSAARDHRGEGVTERAERRFAEMGALGLGKA